MARVRRSLVVDGTGLERLLRPRTGLATEHSVHADEHGDNGHRVASFGDVDGPFDRYQRTVEANAVEGEPDRFHVEEVTDFHIAVPIWGVLFVPLFKRTLRRPTHAPIDPAHPSPAEATVERLPFWAPPDRLDARSATVLGLLCSVAVVVGYLGTVITQTITFAASQFGSTDASQGFTLAAVRAGVLGSVALVALADRKGRRKLVVGSAAAGCLTCVLGAVSTSLWTLGISQAVSRGFATTAIILLTVIAAEEMPAGARAYAVGVMTLTGALGAGMAVWALPLADLGPGGWRILYVLPLVYLPLLLHVWRRLPESRRFAVPHVESKVATHISRLRLLAVTFFLTSVFSQPASQLQNEFLRSERGFAAARISLFTLATGTPGFFGIVIGGRLSDTRGRRVVAAVAVVGGALGTVASYLSHGWPMWAWGVASVMLGAAAVPTLGVFGPELFPTSLRGKANGIIQLIAVAGSSVGLIAAGAMSDHIGLGRAMAVLLVAPFLVGGLLLVAYPETASIELEVLNPEDEQARIEPAVRPGAST